VEAAVAASADRAEEEAGLAGSPPLLRNCNIVGVSARERIYFGNSHDGSWTSIVQETAEGTATQGKTAGKDRETIGAQASREELYRI